MNDTGFLVHLEHGYSLQNSSIVMHATTANDVACDYDWAEEGPAIHYLFYSAYYFPFTYTMLNKNSTWGNINVLTIVI